MECEREEEENGNCPFNGKSDGKKENQTQILAQNRAIGQIQCLFTSWKSVSRSEDLEEEKGKVGHDDFFRALLKTVGSHLVDKGSISALKSDFLG